MTALSKIISDKISKNGALRFDAFWSLALTHPECGYYTNVPLDGAPVDGVPVIGAHGDFITAPEISQVFGEMIGVWAVQQWVRLGSPTRVNLIECGAGRGTLLVDLLRATKNLAGFHDALDIHIIDINPALIAVQKQALSGHSAYNVQWHSDIKAVDATAPCLIVGNEFLDALPVRQFEYMSTRGGWHERYVGADGDGFCFDPCAYGGDTSNFPPPVAGGVFEESPAREGFVKTCAALIKRASGAGVFIDYGHMKSALGDTVQAVKNHKYASIFSDIGAADITSHVDFEPLISLAKDAGVHVSPILMQNTFLYALGLDARVKTLLNGADARQADMIKSGVHRLTAPQEMGTLFKVMEFYK